MDYREIWYLAIDSFRANKVRFALTAQRLTKITNTAGCTCFGTLIISSISVIKVS